ncbi:A disintegrin and metalloproteinase with thrombospondin motifs 3-like isoform X1 [Biomphalaria glabrata]|uniref:A disintegrin and metalloproteinase with thrombospondin motifs 3-like isoform X1 n=2 Tax=Biomphalaria glabrata TaxID=6526 RepID=A0A9W3BNP2_BIOGL|nr:A disintegrin and metalloproteinase with thrombospondin motifs 3-like isoform X1 [Biomphalaria glabrata]
MGREAYLSVSHVLLVLTLLLTWSKQCESLKATLKSINASATTDDSMPKHVDIRMTTEDNYDIRLNLEQVPHSSVPLVLVDVNKGGHFVTKSQLMMPDKNVDFYQDPQNKATLQITRRRNKARENERFDMRGHLVIKGWVYYLNTQQGYEPNDGLGAKYRSDVPRDSPEEVVVESLVGSDLILEKENLLWQLDSDYLSKDFPMRIDENEPVEKRLRWPSFGSARAKRQSRQQYFIDIVAVVDYSLFMEFKRMNDSWDLQTMYRHYAMTFNEVDLIYKALNTPFVLKIQVIKIIVLTTAAASNFSEFYRRDDKLQANSCLNALSLFSGDQGKDIIGACDHVMAFTDYDLFSLSDGQPNYKVAGIANIGVVCRQDGTSSSVIEERFGYMTVIVAAHEFGHSLSAKHDGDGNDCSSDDGYIMAVSYTLSNDMNQYNFSSCSSESIEYYIQNVLRSQEGVECLTKALKVSDSVPIVNDTLPGLELSADEQCRRIEGNDSYYCRQLKPQDICRKLWCGQSTNRSFCRASQMALRGTPCGNKKICSFGQCVEDERGLDLPENCLFGDVTDIVAHNRNCEQLVSYIILYCYMNTSIVRDLCCKSCQMRYRPVPGCEYGDRIKDCKPQYCKFNPSECCETCASVVITQDTRSTVKGTDFTARPSYPSAEVTKMPAGFPQAMNQTGPASTPKPSFTARSTEKVADSQAPLTPRVQLETRSQITTIKFSRSSVSCSERTFDTYHLMFYTAIVSALSSIVNSYVNSFL